MENIINSQSKVSPSFTQSDPVVLSLRERKFQKFSIEKVLKKLLRFFHWKDLCLTVNNLVQPKCFSPSNQKDLINGL